MEENILIENAEVIPEASDISEAFEVPAAEYPATEEKLSALSGENEYLRKKLRCFELGVRPEFIDDTLKLSEDSDIDEVVKNHPDFIGKNTLSDTGVLAVRERSSADAALRRAFGLS